MFYLKNSAVAMSYSPENKSHVAPLPSDSGRRYSEHTVAPVRLETPAVSVE